MQSPEWQRKVHRLMVSASWARLRPQQKIWVLDFIEAADALHATQVAYPKASPKSHILMQYAVRRAVRVRAALAVFHGPTTCTQAEFDGLYAENQRLTTELNHVSAFAIKLAERLLANAAPVLMQQNANIFWRELAQKIDAADAN
jgi:hypothetical protein